MPLKAKMYIALIAASGLAALCFAVYPWESQNLMRFGFYLALALIGSGSKVRLPGITGTLSVYFLFVLLSIVELKLPETMVIVAAATLLQCYWQAKNRPSAAQVVFNTTSNFLAAAAAHLTYQSGLVIFSSLGIPVRLGLAAIVFFVINTATVAIVIGLTEGRSPRQVWTESYFWSFPYYMVGASVAGFFGYLSRTVGWEVVVMLIPVVLLLFRGYRLYLDRLESEKLHAEEVASLHLRTIEALALSIEAKDHVTHDHVQRVQVYALEVGKELGLTKDELNALQAASLLHDIGKLAVPEHIISKPGKLTSEEFEKMKIHPIVGAEILERVRFPYPVVPIVRSHHEKWDGTGYPDGLKGDEIPIGARILSAVDCLDALASDRQYRRAYPLDKAMAIVADESGSSFDPRVVEILKQRYRELEVKARTANVTELGTLSTDAKVERGAAPGAGFEEAAEEARAASCPAAAPADFLISIAAARQEVQALFEMAQELGSSLSLPETLSVLAARLKQLVPFDAFAIYVARNEKLIPEYVIGEDHVLFSSLEIPMGQGLSGWVADNRKPVLNGNPSVEPGYLNDPKKFSKLNSAVAVPLEDCSGVIGVLALYRSDRNAFTRDQLRILQAVTSKLAVAIRNSLMYRQAAATATTDYLTGLPNTRSLFMHLDAELSRCHRSGEPLTVLVCDLDGFKEVNDRFGHLTGNRLLARTATALKDCCREYDYVARMGGDEFVVVLPGMDENACKVRLHQLEQAVEQASVEVCGERLVSLSIGKAHFRQHGGTVEDLLAEADRQMYGNKQHRKGGRARRTIEEVVDSGCAIAD